MTTTPTTPSNPAPSCAITENHELRRTLRALAQQNAQLPHTLSKLFATAVKPLLHVHRDAAREALGSTPGLAKARPLPPAAQASPKGRSAAGSNSTYTTAPEGRELVGGDADWGENLRQDVARQMPPRIPPVSLKLCPGVAYSTTSTP